MGDPATAASCRSPEERLRGGPLFSPPSSGRPSGSRRSKPSSPGRDKAPSMALVVMAHHRGRRLLGHIAAEQEKVSCRTTPRRWRRGQSAKLGDVRCHPKQDPPRCGARVQAAEQADHGWFYQRRWAGLRANIAPPGRSGNLRSLRIGASRGGRQTRPCRRSPRRALERSRPEWTASKLNAGTARSLSQIRFFEELGRSARRP